MIGHRLIPGVEDGDDADLGTKPLGIGGDSLQCLGREAHQHRIDGGLVVEGILGDRGRQREDGM